MRPIRHLLVLAVVALPVSAAADEPAPSKDKPRRTPDVELRYQQAARVVERAQRERQFAEQLSGAALVGHFTVDGQADKPHKPERYEISKARKLEGDTWEITARIKYGEVDVQVPIQLDVLWAGDTPVMSLTDLRIPLMEGSFTCRVLFYGDRYVGTWQHGKVGGHMFGHVERADKQAADGQAPVSGVVTLDGQPVDGAVIEFVPAGGEGKPVSGKTDERGRFALKLPPGEYNVGVKSVKNGVSRLPERYSAAASSGLRVQVADGVNALDFALRS